MSSTSHAQPVGPSGLAPSQSGSHDRPITPGDISVGVVVGRTAGFFDVFVFGIACALVFPGVFFPFANSADGMFYSFAVFALGFVAQPLGSLFFLPLERRFGRATALTAALFLLGCSTVGVAFLPSYSSIGYASIVALCVLRVGQGFAMGGSWDGLPSLLAMKAPKDSRGWYASIPQLGAPIGFIVAAALFAYLWSTLSYEEFFGWGWRYPFFAAFAVNVVALFARLRLVVSPEYRQEFRQRELAPSKVGGLAGSGQGKYVLLGAFAPMASYALLNLVTLFTLSWALLYTQQSPTTFLLIQIIGAIVAIPCMLISGRIADRLGRRVTLGLFATLIAVYSGWTAVLLSGGDYESYVFIILGFALLGFSHALSSGAVAASFRSEFRYTGARFSADLSWLLGAGFAPLVALVLADYFGVGYVGLYLLSGAFCTLAALWVSRRLGGLPNN
ncbi:MAG TPA: MFS transporter [Burkholderiaceae bacterium]|nr:MFS transporter [Burkholderiaceae bacterium]